MRSAFLLRPRVFEWIGLLTLVLPLVTAGTASAEDWPQFRGPNCTGLSTSARPLPVEFSRTKNVHWSVELGDCIGSPAVAGGRVFTTAWIGGKPGQQKLVVFAFDADTGKKLWQKDIPAGAKAMPVIHETNSYASSSPAADAERVYVYFTRVGLLAFDAKTGEQAWKLELPEPFYIFDWGAGMSPVIHKDVLYFSQDDDLFAALYAVDKNTGQILWKDDRSDMAVSYSHPVICTTPKGEELIVAGTGKVLGYDMATGKRKWATELFCRNIKTTPVSKDGAVYIGLESQGISYQWLATADPEGTGKISKDMIRASRKDKGVGIPDEFWKRFDRGDVNKDGFLEGEELDKAFLDPSNQGGILESETRKRAGNLKDWRKWDDAKQTESFLQAVRAGGKGDASKTNILWKIKSKAPDGLVSPIVLDHRMITVKSAGLLSAYDIAKGKKLIYHERLNIEGGIMASPIYGDGKLYITGKKGEILVLDAADFKVLARNDMAEECIATPAIADGRLFIRTRTRLYSVGAK